MNRYIFLFIFSIISIFSVDASNYDTNEKEALKQIIRSDIFEFGLDVSDTLTWNSSNEWISKVYGLTWNDDKSKKLIEILWNYIPLHSVSFSPFSQLTTLDCSYCEIVELDVRKNKKLEELRCSNNQLTEINISENKNLKILECIGNKIERIDTSANPALSVVEWDE